VSFLKLTQFPLPLGGAVYFVINGKNYIIPMATEETSVIASASPYLIFFKCAIIYYIKYNLFNIITI